MERTKLTLQHINYWEAQLSNFLSLHSLCSIDEAIHSNHIYIYSIYPNLTITSFLTKLWIEGNERMNESIEGETKNCDMKQISQVSSRLFHSLCDTFLYVCVFLP